MGKIFSICICGVEQVRRHFVLRGFILYCLFMSSVGFLVFSLVWKMVEPDPLVTALVFLIASFVWLYNLLDIIDIAREQSGSDDPDQKRSDALYEKGRVLYFKGKLDEARGCFEELLNTKRDDVDSVYQLAKIHQDLGNKKESLRLFKRYVKDGDKLEWLEEAKEAVLGKNESAKR